MDCRSSGKERRDWLKSVPSRLFLKAIRPVCEPSQFSRAVVSNKYHCCEMINSYNTIIMNIDHYVTTVLNSWSVKIHFQCVAAPNLPDVVTFRYRYHFCICEDLERLALRWMEVRCWIQMLVGIDKSSCGIRALFWAVFHVNVCNRFHLGFCLEVSQVNGKL
jgi:hypothetical protein